MPQPFPDPNFNTTLGMIQHVNSLTHGLATVSIVILIPIAAFILIVREGKRVSDSIAVALFIDLLLTSLLWAGDLVADKILLIVLILFILSAVFSYFDSE